MSNERLVPWILAALLALLVILAVPCGFWLGRMPPAEPPPAPASGGLPTPGGSPAPGLPAPVPDVGVAVRPTPDEVVDDRLPSDALPGEASVWRTDARGISGAVRESLPRMKRCYEAELARDPALEGTIVARFEIDAVQGVGRVTGLDLETTTAHDPLEACITDVLATLSFDAPTEAVTVSYPLVFAAAP